MKIINPSNGKMIDEINDDTVPLVQEKYQRARRGTSEWKGVPLKERLVILKKFHQALEDHRDELAATLTSEVGKPLQESINEINGARARLQYFLDHSETWLGENKVRTDGNTQESLCFDPLGVVCNISAWNYPLLVGINVYVPALLGGNTVLYKPSEYATLTGLMVERLLHTCGVPQDAFIAVVGAAAVGEALLDLPCDGYFFTGSFKTGQYIAKRVADKLVPVGLELGGKDPLYVTDEVEDISLVAAAVAEGCFYNNGQSCCAVERVYVHEKVYQHFIDAFVSEVKGLTEQGAITRSVHVNFLQEQVDDAIAKGAKLLCGGKVSDKPGFHYPATVLTHVDHSMRVMSEETFGPVIGVMKVKSDEEAIKLMNDTEYGLTAAVYSSDRARARAILELVNSGTSYINCCDRVSPYLPWSGRGHSGLGSTLSYLGILAFVRPRGIHLR